MSAGGGPVGAGSRPVMDAGSGPALEVLAVGPLVLVQDLGRPGLADVGVGRSGAADRGGHRLGARLLAQEESLASLEVLLGGLQLRARGLVTVCLTGAASQAIVDDRRVPHAAPVTVPDGAVLTVGPPEHGLRTYVSVRGGLEVPPVLGSRSRDTLAELGPDPVGVGDVLEVGVAPPALPDVDQAVPREHTGAELALDLLAGPRLDWLADPDALTDATWVVTDRADRIGVRLDGPALDRATAYRGRELPSEPLVRGAVQVPADGQPVVFGADHPVTGGYPVVAVLTEASSDALAQAAPGTGLRLRWP